MSTVHIPLVTDLKNRSSALDKDAKMVNAYIDIESKDQMYAVKRLGYGSGTLYEAAAPQAVINDSGSLLVIVNNKIYYDSTHSVSISASSEIVDYV